MSSDSNVYTRIRMTLYKVYRSDTSLRMQATCTSRACSYDKQLENDQQISEYDIVHESLYYRWVVNSKAELMDKNNGDCF